MILAGGHPPRERSRTGREMARFCEATCTCLRNLYSPTSGGSRLSSFARVATASSCPRPAAGCNLSRGVYYSTSTSRGQGRGGGCVERTMRGKEKKRAPYSVTSPVMTCIVCGCVCAVCVCVCVHPHPHTHTHTHIREKPDDGALCKAYKATAP